MTTRPKLTERWVKETVRWLWGFDLKPFQLADLIALLTGGVISVLYPTDHGKSTLIEMSVVLHVILDPFRANLVIKASPDAAAEFSMVACTLLERAAEKYPWVKPRVRHDQTGTPLPGRGFHVEGGNMANRNKAVMSVSIGARDLQGRRARTHIDDVETMREAMYPRFRELLANRVAATLRTLEDRPDALWAMFGTPYLENTIYYDIVRKLADMGPRHRIIRRPIRDEFGNLLWQERAEKVEMHRRTMSATEWKVAYMLEPITFGKPDPSDVQSMMDESFSFCASERDFAIWLWGWMQRTFRDEFNRPQPEEKLKALWASCRYYIGWDPAARGDWAVGVTAMVAGHFFGIHAYKEPGDVWSQLTQLGKLIPWWPDATIIIEGNGQQKTHMDVFRQRYPTIPITPHQTDGAKDSEFIGIPSLLALSKQRAFHLPYADATGQAMADLVIHEVNGYPGLHGHILPAFWFTHFYDARSGGIVTAGAPPTKREEDGWYKVLNINDYAGRARESWGRISG